MSTLKFSLLLSVLMSVSACSQIAPFEDRRREPGTEYIYVGSSKPGAPAVCYNPLLDKEAEIKEIADDLCQANDLSTEAELVNIDYFTCRLFVPSKAYYKCVPKK